MLVSFRMGKTVDIDSSSDSSCIISYLSYCLAYFETSEWCDVESSSSLETCYCNASELLAFFS